MSKQVQGNAVLALFRAARAARVSLAARQNQSGWLINFLFWQELLRLPRVTSQLVDELQRGLQATASDKEQRNTVKKLMSRAGEKPRISSPDVNCCQQTCSGPLKSLRAAACQASCGLLDCQVCKSSLWWLLCRGISHFCTLLVHKTHCPAQIQPYTVLAGVHLCLPLLKSGVPQDSVSSCHSTVAQSLVLSSTYR